MQSAVELMENGPSPAVGLAAYKDLYVYGKRASFNDFSRTPYLCGLQSYSPGFHCQSLRCRPTPYYFAYDFYHS